MSDKQGSNEFRVNLSDGLAKRLKVHCILYEINYKVLVERAIVNYLDEKENATPATNPVKGQKSVR